MNNDDPSDSLSEYDTDVKTNHVSQADRSQVFGIWKDKMWVAEDAFSPETDQALWKDFWDEDITDPSGESIK